VSGLTIVVVVESTVLAGVALLLLGLLRSHAAILRRLAALEPSGSAVPALDGASSAAHDVAGETLTGDSVKVALTPGSPTTLLAFLSSGCTHCVPLWQELERDGAPLPVRTVVVAKDREAESISRLRELAGDSCDLVLSSKAWADYSIPGSPHFVLIDGERGRIAGRGTAGSWQQIGSMVAQALADGDAHAEPQRTAVSSTGARAARAETALAAAGIEAGHPSLYGDGAALEPPASA
jgi:hypothetical protein